MAEKIIKTVFGGIFAISGLAAASALAIKAAGGKLPWETTKTPDKN